MKKIAYLMHTKAPEEELERTVTNALNRRFFDKDIPNEIIEVQSHAPVALRDRRVS